MVKQFFIILVNAKKLKVFLVSIKFSKYINSTWAFKSSNLNFSQNNLHASEKLHNFKALLHKSLLSRSLALCKIVQNVWRLVY